MTGLPSFIVVAASVDFPTARPTLDEAQALARTLATSHPGRGFHVWQQVAA